MRHKTLRVIISELMATGMSQAKIGQLVSVSQPTISRIGSGVDVDPKDSTATALRELHAKVMAARKRRK